MQLPQGEGPTAGVVVAAGVVPAVGVDPASSAAASEAPTPAGSSSSCGCWCCPVCCWGCRGSGAAREAPGLAAATPSATAADCSAAPAAPLASPGAAAPAAPPASPAAAVWASLLAEDEAEVDGVAAARLNSSWLARLLEAAAAAETEAAARPAARPDRTQALPALPLLLLPAPARLRAPRSAALPARCAAGSPPRGMVEERSTPSAATRCISASVSARMSAAASPPASMAIAKACASSRPPRTLPRPPAAAASGGELLLGERLVEPALPEGAAAALPWPVAGPAGALAALLAPLSSLPAAAAAAAAPGSKLPALLVLLASPALLGCALTAPGIFKGVTYARRSCRGRMPPNEKGGAPPHPARLPALPGVTAAPGAQPCFPPLAWLLPASAGGGVVTPRSCCKAWCFCLARPGGCCTLPAPPPLMRTRGLPARRRADEVLLPGVVVLLLLASSSCRPAGGGHTPELVSTGGLGAACFAGLAAGRAAPRPHGHLPSAGCAAPQPCQQPTSPALPWTAGWPT